jgi:putative CocE/NonD family hydrolase
MKQRHTSSFVTTLLIGTLCTFPTVAVCGAGSNIRETTVQIPMHDGILLEATLALPEQLGAYPTILVRTPYGRKQHLTEARYWATHGYATLVQDARGKWGSGGEYVPFLNEHADGMTTLDWITHQDWSNGSVGMWGSSYLAFCQLVLASTGHPALKSILPVSGWIRDDGLIRYGGAHHIMLSIPWILHEESQTKRSIADVEFDEMFEFLPLLEVFGTLGLESKIWNEEFDFTHLEAYSAANIDIPALHITGWNDFVHDAALGIYEQAVAGSGGVLQKLMVGPWIHDQFYTEYTEVGDDDCGPASALGLERLMKLSLDWFDLTLKNESRDLTDWPAVKLFVMGINHWQDYARWPPSETRSRSLFLGSERGANSSAGDGTLSSEAAEEQGYDTYRFDPLDPVPTYGGANMHFFIHLAGVKDQREIETRNDVLVYTTTPLDEELEIAGAAEVILYASTEGRDTDFTAKLVEVRPSGYARIIEEGILRASYRNGRDERQLLVPGEIYPLKIELGSTAIRLPKGSRIRLEISSSNFPKYDRNPNTGEDPLLARKLQAVNQRIYHGGEFASHLVLPVVERQQLSRAKEGRP